MTQLKKVREPFGEVNVYPGTNGRTRVVATILMEPSREGTQTGIALDGSGSMKRVFGVGDQPAGGGFFSSLFGGSDREPLTNQMTPVGRSMCSYLAERIDADGGTTAIYWAVPPKGKGVEVIGDLTAEQAKRHDFKPPRQFGAETHLLPAVQYFVERFKDAPWGFYVFLTDGELHDLPAVKEYSTQLAKEIAAGKRNPIKFVLVGMGDGVNEKQMEELDDLDTGTDVDLWDHKVAKDMRMVQEIFAECVDKNARIADTGRILTPDGTVVKNYSDNGLPPYLEFEVPNGTQYFTLEIKGSAIHQPLGDGYTAPDSVLNEAAATAKPELSGGMSVVSSGGNVHTIPVSNVVPKQDKPRDKSAENPDNIDMASHDDGPQFSF